MQIEAMMIDEECTLMAAMEQLDQVARKVLFVQKDGRLTAALTDGDIRRWILNKGRLDVKVKDIANYNPKLLHERDKHEAKRLIRQYSVEALPIVDDDMKVVAVVFWNDTEIASCRNLDLPVVMMAGGSGTRLHPYTKVLPKPLIPICDIPIAEHIIQRFLQYRCGPFYIIVNHMKNMIKAYFNEIEKDFNIIYIDEERPLGTGGGLGLLKGHINKTFILTNCDILIDGDIAKMVEFHVREKNLITMICSLKKIQIPYGIIELGSHGEIDGMREKPEFTFFTNTGLYIVEPEVIEGIPSDKASDFPDIIEKCRMTGGKVGVFPISDHAWMDMGQISSLEDMKKRLKCDE